MKPRGPRERAPSLPGGREGARAQQDPAALRRAVVAEAHELLADIDKETVDFVPNYDESES